MRYRTLSAGLSRAPRLARSLRRSLRRSLGRSMALAMAMGIGLPPGLYAGSAHGSEMLSVADIHTHYKWSQEGVTTPAQAIGALREQNVDFAVVIGTPPEYALYLEREAPDLIVPIYGPYNGVRNWFRWTRDPELVADARAALESGDYHGIGELHLIGGFAPRRDSAQVMEALMKLGAEFQKPLLIHTEFSRPKPLLDLCTRHPRTPVLWAHAGAILKPGYVRQVLEACPMVSAEFAARDPWRYVNNPIADEDTGRLLPEWEQLVMDFPERFLVGSDPVWPVEQLDGWDRDDTGWQELGRFLGFHRRWLSFLPEREREMIARTNARRLFGLPPKEGN
ncbi:MAG: amidohydrolase family protein [Gammaproteobacteria bacterium]